MICTVTFASTFAALALAYWRGRLDAQRPRHTPHWVPLPPAPEEADADLWRLDRPRTRETTIRRGIETAQQFLSASAAGVMIVVEEPDGMQHFYGSSGLNQRLSAAATLLESVEDSASADTHHKLQARAALEPLAAYR